MLMHDMVYIFYFKRSIFEFASLKHILSRHLRRSHLIISVRNISLNVHLFKSRLLSS